MESVDEMQADAAAKPKATEVDCIQAGAYLLELSLDWIVCRASENIHKLLDESHVTLIEEPLGKFVQSQPLHDLRNLFSRLSGTTGIARAYRVRLTGEPDLVDIAFQQHDDRVVLEIVPSPSDGLGECLGAVGGLAAGLTNDSGTQLLDAGARRMRALTAFDRVTLLVGDAKSTSDRTGVPFRSGANASLSDGLPILVPDTAAAGVPIFPRSDGDSAVPQALLRPPSADEKAELVERGFASAMRIPVTLDGEQLGEFRLAHTTPRRPSLELHAAAELFAQLFAMRLEIDRLKKG
jgi:light-regulated signal transduction histidine kinase (bacteriophytochrome)